MIEETQELEKNGTVELTTLLERKYTVECK